MFVSLFHDDLWKHTVREARSHRPGNQMTSCDHDTRVADVPFSHYEMKMTRYYLFWLKCERNRSTSVLLLLLLHTSEKEKNVGACAQPGPPTEQVLKKLHFNNEKEGMSRWGSRWGRRGAMSNSFYKRGEKRERRERACCRL